jgi:hypothetical protein
MLLGSPPIFVLSDWGQICPLGVNISDAADDECEVLKVIILRRGDFEKTCLINALVGIKA